MIHEIQAKTLLSTISGEDRYFGLKYNFNLYRGCEHQCIYCDSRSECYGIENFKDTLVKINAIELLEKELRRKRIKGAIGTGSMNDPYMPVELQYRLTRQALKVIARYGFGVHIITKSDLVLQDLATLIEINRAQAVVCFTLTTLDDDLAKKVEPGAPLPSARLKAMRILANEGISTGVSMMPILPFIEDTPENVLNIIEQTAAAGGKFIVPAFGLSLRDRQRAYYYEQLDRLFPGLRQKYERCYGNQYSCGSGRAKELAKLFYERCREYGLADRIAPYQPEPASEQLSLF